jgi:hypothetical protein
MSDTTHARRHAEMMVELHTIGRNIALHDKLRSDIRWSLERIGNILIAALILAFVAVVGWLWVLILVFTK